MVVAREVTEPGERKHLELGDELSIQVAAFARSVSVIAAVRSWIAARINGSCFLGSFGSSLAISSTCVEGVLSCGRLCVETERLADPT